MQSSQEQHDIIYRPHQKILNIFIAEPDEVKKDGSGGLEGGDVGEGILWKDQPCRALPQQ